MLRGFSKYRAENGNQSSGFKTQVLGQAACSVSVGQIDTGFA